MKSAKPALALLMAAALLVACGAKDSAALAASAREYMAKGDTKSAIIELKTALQTGDSPEIRFLMGQALLQSGDPVAATVELRKAREQNHPDEIVLPSLAAAMLAAGEVRSLVDQFASVTLKEAKAQAELKTAVANALARLGETGRAKAAIEEALVALPDHVPALVFQARVKAATGDLDGGMKAVEAILAQHADAGDAWQLKAELLAFQNKDVAGAEKAYEEALKHQKDARASYAGLVSLALARKDLAAAQSRLEAMQKAVGNGPLTRYLGTQLALNKGDLKAAKEGAEQLLKAAPEHLGFLQLAGAVSLQAREYQQAEAHLAKVLQRAPGDRKVRLLLAQTFTRSGQGEKALSTIQPLLEGSSGDADALALAGEAHMQAGDIAKAEEAYQKAAKLNPDDKRSRTALAVVNLNKGNLDSGFGELESIAQSDPGTTADLTLISAHLRRGEFDDALKAIERLSAKQPDKPFNHYVKGLAQLGLKQEDQASQSFEAAVKADPAFFAAVAQLAMLDVRANKTEVARQRFETVLKASPGHVGATLALVQMATRQGGDSGQVLGLLADSIKANPTVAAPRLRLVAQHLAAKDTAKALSAAQDAVAALPNDASVLEALGGVQYAAGEKNQALATFNKLVSLQPKSPAGPLRLTDLHLANKDYNAARQSILRAQDLAPGAPEILQRRIAIEMAAGRTPDALAVARAEQKRNPKSGFGLSLEGDVQLAARNWEGAATAYKAALKITPAPQLALKVHTALRRGGKTAEAGAFAQGWLKEHPNDVAFIGYQADLSLAAKDNATAERLYEDVLKLQPTNARALNNIAWLKLQSGVAGALSYAEKANQLAPRNPALMDTLAQAYLVEKRNEDAVKLLKQALEIDPEAHGIRMTLARAYIAAGEKGHAKDELDRLSKLGDKFREQPEVSRLLGGL